MQCKLVTNRIAIAMAVVLASGSLMGEESPKKKPAENQQESSSTAEPMGWLGVRLAPQASSISRGVELTGVMPGSPAEKAGLKAGDKILNVDETRVEAAADLQVAIGGRKPGETVQLAVDHDGKRRKVKVKLGALRRWRGNVADLTEGELREFVVDLLAAPLALTDELLPDDGDQAKGMREEVNLPRTGAALLIATKGHEAGGMIALRQKDDGLHLTGQVRGLKPGLHGFHIHQYGDLRDVHGKAAGGHFNPRGVKHAGPEDEEHHAGDLGNIRANKDGVAEVDVLAPWLKLHFVAGRSIVVHSGEDDLESQPSGDAGERVAIGVIGIAKTPGGNNRAE